MRIRPTKFIEQLTPYKSVSHKVWEYTYNNHISIVNEVIKLDWNEATKFETKIIKEILKYFTKHEIRLNWYPDIENKILIKKISEYVGCKEENIQYFGGSDAALEYIARTYVSENDRIGILSPTYDNFRVYVESCGGKIFFIFNKSPFLKDVDNTIRQLSNIQCRVVYIVNPNNPTGLLYDPDEVKFIIERFPETLFIVDEAYFEFCNVTCAPYVSKYDNIIITRSFTKAFGLGGFRLGYIVAPAYIVESINKIRVGKNINVFAQVAGIVVLDNQHYMREYVKEVKEAKKVVIEELQKKGYEVISTPANFVLIKVEDHKSLVKKLEDNNVFIRDRSSDPQLDGYVRITIGDKETMKKFLERFNQLVK